ncbi:aldehyde dehydrogenase family protein [uncultured Mycobacterium sp.]|uniref:aldehyde dehydrogenase family protein n=1 Tax=uncultured Mycobacterium sp. TaxID=171292 RepID=UPI0035CC526D
MAFTGSSEVGREIVHAAGASDLKKVTLELGGKSPVVVFDDADLNAAIPMTAFGTFIHSGQACVCGSRIFARRAVYEQVVEGLANIANTLQLGGRKEEGADECGAVNLLLAAAPNAEVIHGPLACMLSLTDMCDRPPIVASEDIVHDIGGHRLRFIATPHVPHNRESGLWFDETTSTLLAGDLLTHTGQCPALTESDCVAAALDAEAAFRATAMSTNLGPTLEQLTRLQPTTLALMQGASFTGDGVAQLRGLAPGYAALGG